MTLILLITVVGVTLFFAMQLIHPYGAAVEPAPQPRGPEPRPQGRRDGRHEDDTGINVQVLFATAMEDEVVLDCIAMPSGEPFTICAEVDCSAAYGALFVESILSKWADSGEPVSLEIVEGADGRAVRLSGDGSRVQLPLLTTA